MTCAEARDRFSDVVDRVISVAERRDVDAHLVDCADCRRDFERFTATVALLRSVEPERAPVGFVDRVIRVATPKPWYRQLADHLLLPLPVKLPIEAAAIVLVAVGVVYVFNATPELRRAARVEAPAPPATAPQPPAATERYEAARSSRSPARESPKVASSAPKAQEPSSSDLRARSDTPASPQSDVRAKAPADAAGKTTAMAPVMEQGQTISIAAERPAKQDALVPVASGGPSAIEGKKESEVSKDAEGARRDPLKSASAPPMAAPVTPPPPSSERPGAQPGSVAPAAPAPARSQAPPSSVQRSAAAPAPLGLMSRGSDVAGRLEVGDDTDARRALTDVITRYGGTDLGQRAEADATVIDVVVPRATYADVMRELATIGRWTLDREPTALPDRVRINIRLTRRS